MEQAKQMMEMDPARINRDFYYTLALLQYEAVNYVARADDGDSKLIRAKSIIEQVQEIIKTVGELSNEIPDTCIPPCYPEGLWKEKCICPKLKDDGGVVGPLGDVVSTQM